MAFTGFCRGPLSWTTPQMHLPILLKGPTSTHQKTILQRKPYPFRHKTPKCKCSRAIRSPNGSDTHSISAPLQGFSNKHAYPQLWTLLIFRGYQKNSRSSTSYNYTYELDTAQLSMFFCLLGPGDNSMRREPSYPAPPGPKLEG